MIFLNGNIDVVTRILESVTESNGRAQYVCHDLTSLSPNSQGEPRLDQTRTGTIIFKTPLERGLAALGSAGVHGKTCTTPRHPHTTSASINQLQIFSRATMLLLLTRSSKEGSDGIRNGSGLDHCLNHIHQP
jgi:hypothetical protein